MKKYLLCVLAVLAACSKELGPKAERPLGVEERRYQKSGHLFGTPFKMSIADDQKPSSKSNTEAKQDEAK